MGKVPDTPPEPPTPSSSSSSGAGAGAGASGRAASAAAGAASWWDGVVKFSRRELERGRSKLKGIDLQPHMTVEMDFIKPFATNVKSVWRDACAQVPPPVKKAAPFALSAAGGCIVTHAIMKAANVRTLPHSYSLRARLPSLFCVSASSYSAHDSPAREVGGVTAPNGSRFTHQHTHRASERASLTKMRV